MGKSKLNLILLECRSNGNQKNINYTGCKHKLSWHSTECEWICVRLILIPAVKIVWYPPHVFRKVCYCFLQPTNLTGCDLVFLSNTPQAVKTKLTHSLYRAVQKPSKGSHRAVWRTMTNHRHWSFTVSTIQTATAETNMFFYLTCNATSSASNYCNYINHPRSRGEILSYFKLNIT